MTLPPLLQDAPVAIAAFDPSGRLTHANRELLETSGYSLDEIAGLSFSTFFTAAGDAGAHDRFLAFASGAADAYRGPATYRTRDGSVRDIELSVSTSHDGDGVVQLRLAALQDHTERNRAIESAARSTAQLAAVIESVPAAVYVGDASGIAVVNAAGLELLGHETPDQLKRPIADLSGQLENRDAASGAAIEAERGPFMRALAGEKVDAEIISRHLKTGESIVHRVIATPVRVAGRIVGAVSVSINITERQQTAAALRLSEKRYRALIEQSPLSIQILSPDGRTLQVNTAWERLWGATLERLSGYNMLEDWQLEARGLMPYIRQGFAGEPANVPASLYDPDETIPDAGSREDRRRWVRAVIYPVKDDRGHIREVVLIHEDITEQVRSDEERRAATELLQLVIQQSGDGIVVADADGVVRIFNQAAERLHGVAGGPTPPEEWTRHYRLLREDGSPLPFQETALYRALQGEAVSDARWLVSLGDGSTRTLVGTAAPLRTPAGEPAGAVLITRDETTRLAAETERERLLVETQGAHRDVESASRLKDEFLATLSHELRTPLNAVLGWTRILRARLTDEPSAHALEVIERNAAAQARLIDDLLDVSRIIAGKIHLHFEAMDVARIAAAALETVRPAADARGVGLEAEIAAGLPPMDGDPQRLQQVLWNLLSNAVKFTDAGGRVRLSVECSGRCIDIVVSDNGIGISPELLPIVFDRFTQGDVSTTRTHTGLGLGLAIVRHLVDLHGGTVTAESAGPGRGATFRLRLPIRSASRQ